MPTFSYHRPKTLAEALALLSRHGAGARLLMGGTDLVVHLQKGIAAPQAIIDLKRVGDISDGVEIGEAETTIGARMLLADLLAHEHVRRHYPALIEAASVVGSVQIRNRATLVGNLCNASPAADTTPALMVYGASVSIAGPGGVRRLPLGEFFLGPGRTARGPAEIVTAVTLPMPRQPFGSAFGRMTRRRGVDLAIISVACAIDSAGVATFAFGAAGPTVIVAQDPSGVLGGGQGSLTDTSRHEAEAALKTLIEKTMPISDVRSGEDYRRAMLLTLGRRVWERATHRVLRGAADVPTRPV